VLTTHPQFPSIPTPVHVPGDWDTAGLDRTSAPAMSPLTMTTAVGQFIVEPPVAYSRGSRMGWQ
jgi:hypothetical protein